jgi:predicted ribosome quality control (RQC) complex YloA/Tae2 family protein
MNIIGEEGEVTLVIEPMERRSNIILVQNGMILDCARRIGPQENRYRITLPAHQYVAPPPIEGRMNPADLTLESFAPLFEGLLDPELKTTSLLSSNLLGMSGLLAREAVVRAGGSVTQKAQDAHVSVLYRVLTEEIFAPLLKREWQPV